MIADDRLPKIDARLRANNRSPPRRPNRERERPDQPVAGCSMASCLAHQMPRLIDRNSENYRIGTRKINVFKGADRILFFFERKRRMQTVFVNDEHFAGFDLADVFGIDQIERAGFRRDAPRIFQFSQNHRTKSAWVTNGDQSIRREKQKRKRAFRILQNFGDGFDGIRRLRVRAIECRIVSVSEVEEKIAPAFSNSTRFCAANGRFPL